MKVLVTGATGFLGGRIAEILHAQGNRVTATGRNREVGEKFARQGITFSPLDLLDRSSLREMTQGHGYVIHCAALSNLWGRYRDFYNANVLATQNVIDACRKNHVSRLVHISSPSIYVDQHDRFDIQESDPLPSKQMNSYSQTKLLAEKEVDAAFKSGLATVTLRPQGIIGPGDRSIVPRILKLAQKRPIPIIGDQDVQIDLTYVDNVADAAILALQSASHTTGKKYNISNGTPVNQVEMIKKLLCLLGMSARFKKIGFRKAWLAARAMEFASRTFSKKHEPLLTRYSVCVLSKSRTLNIQSAQSELGFVPRVSLDEGLSRFVNWWKAQAQ